MASNWDEIKRLAADFQRAQLTSSYQKLSERNCVEIINKLVEKKLIEIYFTSNGKEYVTPEYLEKQIKDELYVHSGRINLTELSSILDISLSLIEKVSFDVAKRYTEIHLLLGQLISNDYIHTITEEINEKLHQTGFITVAKIAQIYDLPGNFIQEHILKRHLDRTIKGQQDESDPQTIFTDAFISKHEFQIRGILSAVMHPTVLYPLISKYCFQEKLFFSIVDKLISSGVVQGSVSGGRHTTHCVFTPTVYSKAQFEWVDGYLRQNNYLDFKSLSRLGISEPHSYIKKNFKSKNLTFISGACVAQIFIDQIQANIDDALANGTFVDVLPFLPSDFSDEMCLELIELSLKTREENAKSAGFGKFSPNCRVFCGTIVVSDHLLTSISLKLEDLMPNKAKEIIATGIFKQQLSNKTKNVDENLTKKKDDRRKKAAGGKLGGGTQGRETKTKSTKKGKGNKRMGNHSESEDENDYKNKLDIEFLSKDEIINEIAKLEEFEDCLEDLLAEIADFLKETLNRKFIEIVKELYHATMSGEGDSRKRNHQHMQEKVVALLSSVKLAEKSLKEFSTETREQLSKYLLKTQCSEIFNEILLYLADDSQIELKQKELSIELRLKIINQLDKDMKAALLTTHKSLAGSVESFLACIDDAFVVADVINKKKDNKRDKQILQNHRNNLIEQLNACLNFAMSLHLACLILFQSVTGNMIHASGKFVPQILDFLKLHLNQEFFDELKEYQNLVMTSLTSKDESALSTANTRLEELTPKLKEATVSFKKSKDKENSISEN